MTHIKNSKLALVISFLVIFFFSNVVTLLAAPLAHAEDWSGTNPVADEIYKNTSAHQHYYWLYSCFRNVDIDEVTPDEMTNWNFFYRDSKDSWRLTALGAMYPGESDDDNIDGIRSCYTPSLVQQAFVYLGFDGSKPREAFCGLDGAQYRDDHKGDYNDCVAGIDNHSWDNNLNDTKKQAAAFEKLVQSKKPPFGGPETYLRAYLTLTSERGCAMTFDDTTLYQTSDDVPGASESATKYPVPVMVPNSSGKGYLLRYVLGVGRESGHSFAYVATTNGYSSDGDHYQKKTCKEVSELAISNAKAYLDWLNNHPDASLRNDLGGGAGTNGQNGSTNSDPTCETEGGPLAWFGCAALMVLDGISSALDSIISNLLFIDKNQFNNDGVKNAWGVMRNIALLILVPMMMLMVIGTALEFGPFDAYTVKKALPRMMIAVIFIVLSLVLTQAAIRISNSFGDGVGNILDTAMRQAGTPIGSLQDLFSSKDGYAFYGLAAGGLGIGALTGFTFISWGILGSLALVTIVALLIGALILVIRQVLIIFLVILAPLAILVWIFPGNDKLWKIWRTTFTAMLLMYPLIILLILSGRFFAGVVKASDPSLSLVNIVLMLAAYITPYFLIPSAFKYGLGVFGNLAGMINDRSRGFFDKQRKSRDEKRAGLRQRASEGNRFQGGNSTNFRGRLNRGISTTRNAPSAILSSGNTFSPGNWRSAVAARTGGNTMGEIERNLKENTSYQSWVNDDDMNRAASESHDEASLRARLVAADARRVAKGKAARFSSPEEMDNAVARVQTTRRSMSEDAFRAMTTRQALSGGTAYDTAGEAWAAVARAGGNNDALTASLIANGRSDLMKAGRIDQGGAGFGTTLDVVRGMQDELRRTDNISASTMAQASERIHQDIYESQGGASLVHSSMKASAVSEMAPEMVRTVENARTLGDDRDLTQSLASLAAVYDGLSGSSPAKARIMADQVMSHKLDVSRLSPEMQQRLQHVIQPTRVEEVHVRDPATGNMTVQRNTVASGPPLESITLAQAIEGMRGNAEFKEMRREYASEVDRARAGGPPDPNAEPNALPGRP